MKDVLIVLNPRRIRICIDAIQSLPIDRLWLRNMSEPAIAQAWMSEILPKIADYDRAFIVSDDACPRPHALELVRGLLDDGAPVATGYSNLAEYDHRVNLCPLAYPDTRVHLTLAEVQRYPEETVPTSFAGFSLTAMSLDLWRIFPYQTMPGGSWGADEALCRRLADHEIPIVAHRDALVWHVKKQWNERDTTPGRKLRVGVKPPAIELDSR